MGILFISPAGAAERQVLQGQVLKAVTDLNLQPVGRLSGSTNMELAITLPLRDRKALSQLLREQYDPLSPLYHHWLMPDQFAARFGPTKQDYQAVINFARSNGFIVTGIYSNRALLDVRGSVADIERTFRVVMLTYRHPTEDREFYAPDVEPSVDLSVAILHVAGLINYVLPRPASTPENISTAVGSGSPVSYLASDLRAVYIPGVSLTGSGQVVGLVEFAGYHTNDITTYEATNGLPNVTLTNVVVDGFDKPPSTNLDEMELDIEMAIAMAPGLSGVIVYEAPENGAYEGDLLTKIATDDLAKQISSSWFFSPSPDLDQIYQQFEAQGQSFFQASGDNGAYTNSWPHQQQAVSPYFTAVGGTTLTTTNATEVAWLSEVVWNANTNDNPDLSTPSSPSGDHQVSGGGISTDYTIPSWQQGIDVTFNHGSTTQRNVPDVAMVAANIYIIAFNGMVRTSGGTSAAAPLWAGFTALVNQQAAAYGRSVVGFINPAIYAIGKGTNYNDCFHDITASSNITSLQPTNHPFKADSRVTISAHWVGHTPSPESNLVNALAPPCLFTLSTSSVALRAKGGSRTLKVEAQDADCDWTAVMQ